MQLFAQQPPQTQTQQPPAVQIEQPGDTRGMDWVIVLLLVGAALWAVCRSSGRT